MGSCGVCGRGGLWVAAGAAIAPLGAALSCTTCWRCSLLLGAPAVCCAVRPFPHGRPGVGARLPTFCPYSPGASRFLFFVGLGVPPGSGVYDGMSAWGHPTIASLVPWLRLRVEGRFETAAGGSRRGRQKAPLGEARASELILHGKWMLFLWENRDQGCVSGCVLVHFSLDGLLFCSTGYQGGREREREGNGDTENGWPIKWSRVLPKPCLGEVW